MGNTPSIPDSNAISKSDIATFYDSFSERLLAGFITGNPRIEHALDFAVKHIPPQAKNLLEIGCGVGETTNRLTSSRRDLSAVGVDISPENVRTAQRLFADSSQASFTVSDLSVPVDGGPFDVVTLLDVYEHIPSSDRTVFHANLRQAMSEKSRLIVTCPSYLHQQHLRLYNPDGLQIVDETIGPAEFVQLANDLGGQLTHLHYESVWRTNDYVYAVIDSTVDYSWKPKARGVRRLMSKVSKLIDTTPFGGPARRSRYAKQKLAG